MQLIGSSALLQAGGTKRRPARAAHDATRAGGHDDVAGGPGHAWHGRGCACLMACKLAHAGLMTCRPDELRRASDGVTSERRTAASEKRTSQRTSTAKAARARRCTWPAGHHAEDLPQNAKANSTRRRRRRKGGDGDGRDERRYGVKQSPRSARPHARDGGAAPAKDRERPDADAASGRERKGLTMVRKLRTM